MRVDDLSGQVLDGRYRVIEPIGEGAMGSVYRAERIKLGRIVAVKVINERLPDEMSAHRRFEREAMAMAKLEHPHCASVLDVGVHNNRPYVVMDFVSGQNLTELIDRGPVAIPRAVEITRQVLSGLAHAHEHGIFHRDIKPGNIVLSQKSGLGDHVKILDFGLARTNADTSSLTTGVVVGTPSYMAPEQVRGILIDGRADLYACGIMLFELLTGIKPFRSANNEPLEVCMMHMNVPPPRLADKLPGVDFGGLEQIIVRALAKDRDQRYATAGEFANALGEVVGRPSYQTPAVGVPATASLPGPATAVLTGPRADQVPPRADQAPTSALVFDPASASVSVFEPAPVSAHAFGPASASGGSVASRPSPSASLVQPHAAQPRATGRMLAIGGGVVALIVVIAVIATTRGDSNKVVASLPIAADAGVALVQPTPEPTADDPVSGLVARASELAAAGQHKAGIDLLVKARKTYPKDARLPFLAGKLYVARMFMDDGLPFVRAALKLDPALRSDPEIIKLILRGFNTTAQYDGVLARFLREDIGAAAKPYLEDTAKNHTNAIVRKRAATELRRYE